jgi:hypothetical protein
MRRLSTLLSIGALALAGCIGNIGGEDPGKRNEPGPSGYACNPEDSALTPSPIRRLARIYFENSVREFLSSVDETTRAAMLDSIKTRFELVPADTSDHFSLNDDTVSQDHVDAVFGVAVALAAKISEDPSFSTAMMSPCGAGATAASLQDDACLTSFVTHYGRKAFRRPLAQAEIDDFKAFYHQAMGQGVDGLGMLVGRFIAHPSFYYRFDSEGEKLEGTDGADAVYELTKWELLSKVTFLFWAAPPTDALYDFVESTDVTQDDGLAALVDQVLADPKAEQGVLRFYREWLELDTTKTPATEGNVVAGQAMLAASGIAMLPVTYREDMIQEVLDLTRHYTLTTNGKLGDIFTSQYSFARTPELAKIYGVEPWSGSPDQLVTLPAGERSGLLTRAAMLTSGAEYTRPVIKGHVIRSRILCDVIAPPPAELEIKPLVHAADKTTRQAVDEATAAETCQGCHKQMNPLGYLSENYDPTGRFRTVELRFAEGTADVVAELPIDTRVVPQIDEDDTTEIANAVDLGAYIAETNAADACMVENYFEFVTGRSPDPKADGCDIVDMYDRMTAEDGSIQSMLRATVMRESFRRRLVQ